MLGDETLSNIAATNFEPRLSLAGAPTYDELCQAFPEADDEPIIAAIPNVASEDEDVFGTNLEDKPTWCPASRAGPVPEHAPWHRVLVRHRRLDCLQLDPDEKDRVE